MSRYKGLCHPITKHPRGLLRNTDDISQIKSSLACILLTHPGERVFEPFFGTPLIDIQLAQPKKVVKDQFRELIAKSIKRWEKRVQITDIIVDIVLEKEIIILKIKVMFIDPISLSEIHELSIQKSLGDANGRSMPF